jgi:hypothetical protein
MVSFAIVLGEEDLKVLIFDFVEILKEQLSNKGKVTAEQLAEVLMVLFEELVDEYEVDGMIVKVGGECYMANSGEEFVELVKKFYGNDLAEILLSGNGVGDEKVVKGEQEIGVVDK